MGVVGVTAARTREVVRTPQRERGVVVLTADGEALGWVAAQLDRHGLRVTGDAGPPRVRPWSTVLPVPTNGGTVCFKANAAGTVYEPRLLEALAGWRVAHVLTPLAVDAERTCSPSVCPTYAPPACRGT